VYEKNKWGGEKGQFYSGIGSDVEKLGDYIKVLREFIVASGTKSVVDIGCGDFRVGQAIINGLNVRYTGIDVVEKLIAHNNQVYADDKVNFLCLNAATAPLPPADLCHIRQVLQHLGNEQIASILNKAGNFKYLIITEHVPTGSSVKPNVDMPPNSGTRIARNSGVFVERPPFNLKAETIYELQWDDHYPAVIRTSLIRVKDQ
jgi:SAM-dependent methyltransferase